MELPDELDVTTWLVEHRADLDRGEAEWLDRLAEFDRDGLWALDRHFCCATWLVWRTNMARSTAFEKLRIFYPQIAGNQRGGKGEKEQIDPGLPEIERPPRNEKKKTQADDEFRESEDGPPRKMAHMKLLYGESLSQHRTLLEPGLLC